MNIFKAFAKQAKQMTKPLVVGLGMMAGLVFMGNNVSAQSAPKKSKADTLIQYRNRPIVDKKLGAGTEDRIKIARKSDYDVGHHPKVAVSAPAAAPKFKDKTIVHPPKDNGGPKGTITWWKAFTAKYAKDHPGHTWTGDHSTKEVIKVPVVAPVVQPSITPKPAVIDSSHYHNRDTSEVIIQKFVKKDTVTKQVVATVQPLPVNVKLFAGREQSWSQYDYAKGHNTDFVGLEVELPQLAHKGFFSNVGFSVRAQAEKRPKYFILDQCPEGCLIPAYANANNNRGYSVETAVELNHVFKLFNDGLEVQSRVLGGMKYRSRENITEVATTDFNAKETPAMLREQQTWADFGRASLDIMVPLFKFGKKHNTRLDFTANAYGEVNGFSGSHYIAQDAAHSPYGPREKAIYNNKIWGGSAGLNLHFK